MLKFGRLSVMFLQSLGHIPATFRELFFIFAPAIVQKNLNISF